MKNPHQSRRHLHGVNLWLPLSFAALAMLAGIKPAEAQKFYSIASPVTIHVKEADPTSITAPGAITSTAAVAGTSPLTESIAVAPILSLGVASQTISVTGPVDVVIPLGYTVAVTSAATMVDPEKNSFTIDSGAAPSPVSITVVKAPPAVVADNAKQNGFMPGLDIMIGGITLNPYSIVPNGTNGFKVQNNNATTSLIVMLDYANRWAWNPNNATEKGEFTCTFLNGWNHGSPLTYFDFAGRLGYSFGQNNTNTSTVVGAGDLNLELMPSFVIFRKGDGLGNNQSFNFDVGYTLVTDRQFSTAHTSALLGASYVASFVGPYQNGTANRTLLLLRGGAAYYELPDLTTDGTGNIRTDNIGNPEFTHTWGTFVEVEAKYQLPAGTYLTAGALAYPNNRVSPWSLWFGVSVSLDQLGTLASGLVTSSSH